MIAEETATKLALDIGPVFLLPFVSFHVLIHATIVFLLGVIPESTTAHLALATRYGFLFRYSLSLGEKAYATAWCHAITELLRRVLSE
jgi:hypothetical protein